jgi:hypothetical protein
LLPCELVFWGRTGAGGPDAKSVASAFWLPFSTSASSANKLLPMAFPRGMGRCSTPLAVVKSLHGDVWSPLPCSQLVASSREGTELGKARLNTGLEAALVVVELPRLPTRLRRLGVVGGEPTSAERPTARTRELTRRKDGDGGGNPSRSLSTDTRSSRPCGGWSGSPAASSGSASCMAPASSDSSASSASPLCHEAYWYSSSPLTQIPKPAMLRSVRRSPRKTAATRMVSSSLSTPTTESASELVSRTSVNSLSSRATGPCHTGPAAGA